MNADVRPNQYEGHEVPVALYSESFRKRMVENLTGPHATTATALSAEVGVSQSTLSRWLRGAGTVVRTMPPSDDDKNVAPPAKRPQDWTADEKWALVLEAAAVPQAELGAFLRRKGVHEAQLVEWREAAMAGLQRPSRRERKAADLEKQRVRKLERELQRKDKALAEAAALLVLKKSPGDLGGRGRRHDAGERRMIRQRIAEAVVAGAHRKAACERLGLTARTVERWADHDDDRRRGPNTAPANSCPRSSAAS